jgi:hypothetical protein
MGRDLLAEDYMLKQITASLIYPEDEIGKKFWKRIYEESAKRYGTTNIPVNTFNKVWIIPEKAVFYENAKAGTAYVVESKLKVMLEQDYLALQKNNSLPLVGRVREGGQDVNSLSSQIVRASTASSELSEKRRDSSLASNILRAIVIPELTKEVNENKNFAQLRQVYNSLILATWYKKKIKDSILAQIYDDKNKIQGLLNVKATQRNELNDVEYIYQQYLKAFKKGVYNYIKEGLDPVTQETIPRKYFSGGILWDMDRETFTSRPPDAAQIGNTNRFLEISSDLAMSSFLRPLIKVNRSKKSAVKTKIIPPKQSAGDLAMVSNEERYFLQLAGEITIIGRMFLSQDNLIDIGRALSWMDEKDRNELKIIPLPFYAPQGVLFNVLSSGGAAYLTGTNTVLLPLNRDRKTFRWGLIHEITHKLLEKKKYLLDKLSEGVFNGEEKAFPGVRIPTSYADTNREEYICELVAHAVTFPNSKGIITDEQRSILATELFKLENPQDMYFPDQNYESNVSTKDALAISALAHTAFLSWFYGYNFKYASIYLAGVTLGLTKEFIKHKSSEDGDFTGGRLFKIKQILSQMATKSLLGLLLISLYLNPAGKPGREYFLQDKKSQNINQLNKENEIELMFIDAQNPSPPLEVGVSDSNQKTLPSFTLHEDQVNFLGKVKYQYQPDQNKELFSVLSMMYQYYGKNITVEEIEKNGHQFDLDGLSSSHIQHLVGQYSFEVVNTSLWEPYDIENSISRMLDDLNNKKIILMSYFKDNTRVWGIVVGAKRRGNIGCDIFYIRASDPNGHIEKIDGLKEQPFMIEFQPFGGKKDGAMINQLEKQTIPKSNTPSLSNLGGIDLTPANMNLQTKVMDSRFRGNDSEGIKFQLDPAMLAQLQNAPGFVPVIINIQPMTDLRQFLGIDAAT